MEGVSCCTWVNISKNTVVRPDWQVNCDKMRSTNMNESSIEIRCLISCLHLTGTYDQLNSSCLTSMETVVRRIAQIVEFYCQMREANHVGSGDITTKITRVLWTVWDRICELLSKENSRGTGSWTPRDNWQTWLLLEGKVTRSHVSEMILRRTRGLTTADAMNISREGTIATRIKSFKNDYEVVLDFIFLWFMSWDRVRRDGDRCVYDYVTTDTKTTSMSSSRVSIDTLGQERRLQLIGSLSRDKIWWTARIRE